MCLPWSSVTPTLALGLPLQAAGACLGGETGYASSRGSVEALLFGDGPLSSCWGHSVAWVYHSTPRTAPALRQNLLGSRTLQQPLAVCQTWRRLGRWTLGSSIFLVQKGKLRLAEVKCVARDIRISTKAGQTRRPMYFPRYHYVMPFLHSALMRLRLHAPGLF